MHPAKAAISQLTIDSPSTCQGLTMFPLQSPVNGTMDYLLLSEALQAGLVSVREVSQNGSVPDLVIENHADRPLLIVDGEELTGAKQNRVVNLTLLIPANRVMTIPVSCVEQGRWSFESSECELSEYIQFASGRAEKLAGVQASMRSTGTRYSDQTAVWDSIMAKSVAMGARSPTGAMEAIFEQYAQPLDDVVAHFQAVSGQIGGVFAVGGALCGLDVFDKPATFKALLPKLVRSYGIDALEQGPDTESPPNPQAVKAFLADIIQGDLKEHRALGLGHDIGITATGVFSGGLVFDTSLIHLAAFTRPSTQQTDRGTRDSFATSRQRRHSYRRRHQ